ncbi:MAG: transporter substrate-binding domain-containing protein [Steroidobacteraceae bacterium]
MTLQARLAREVQGNLHAQWAATGFSYPGQVSTLARLRPGLDSLTVELLQSLYVAAPVLERRGFAAGYASLAQRQLQGAGWTDESRRDLLGTLELMRQTRVPALQRIETAGILRVGTTGDYAPFSMESSGTLSGSDIELAQELAAGLHTRAVFVRTSWRSLLDDLSAGKFDLAMGGVSVTPARAAQAAFSLAYFWGGKTIIARCGDSRKFRAPAAIDRPKVRVIVNPGGTNEEYVRAHLQRAQIVVYPDNRRIFDELGAGRADVMITDDVEAELQTRHHPGLCRTYPGTLTRSQKAILMPRDPDLLKAINEWLGSALASGEPARLLKSYLER